MSQHDPSRNVYEQYPPPQVRHEKGPPTPGYSERPPSYGQPQPVVSQPGGHGGPGQGQPAMMNPAQPPLNCPPGLEYLAMVDQLLVHQKIEMLEAFIGFETNNKYQIKNSLGQHVYYAIEDTDCLTRQCCGPARPFDMKILDNFNNEVIHLYRPLACSSCCFPCCLQNIEVTAPPGNVIGSVQQEWSIFYPTFAIKNASGETVMRIEGPFLTFSCCSDVKFRITSADGSQELGKITKQWSGLLREAFTDADNFGISFPMDLDVKMKAVMLGACFLIDMMFFEHSN